jgi:spermidine synthase
MPPPFRLIGAPESPGTESLDGATRPMSCPRLCPAREETAGRGQGQVESADARATTAPFPDLHDCPPSDGLRPTGPRVIPWVLLARAPIPGTAQALCLYRRGELLEFSIQISGYVSELMNSRVHASEDALAELGCAAIVGRPAPHVLVGGLGMGFTLAAALRVLGPDSVVTVAELVPEVVEWNRGPLGECAAFPLRDPRTRVHVGDVAELLRRGQATYDAVLLDVDNGPEGMTHHGNNWLYSPSGLAAAQRTLRPGGVLAVWSATPDERFTRRLRQAGYQVEVRTVRARPGKGAHHTIWLAQRTQDAVLPARFPQQASQRVRRQRKTRF